jgi:hypothetical protein
VNVVFPVRAVPSLAEVAVTRIGYLDRQTCDIFAGFDFRSCITLLGAPLALLVLRDVREPAR